MDRFDGIGNLCVDFGANEQRERQTDKDKKAKKTTTQRKGQKDKYLNQSLRLIGTPSCKKTSVFYKVFKRPLTSPPLVFIKLCCGFF